VLSRLSTPSRAAQSRKGGLTGKTPFSEGEDISYRHYPSKKKTPEVTHGRGGRVGREGGYRKGGKNTLHGLRSPFRIRISTERLMTLEGSEVGRSIIGKKIKKRPNINPQASSKLRSRKSEKGARDV